MMLFAVFARALPGVRRWQGICLILSTAAVVVAPWSVRNYLQAEGVLVPVAAIAGTGLGIGNNECVGQESVLTAYWAEGPCPALNAQASSAEGPCAGGAARELASGGSHLRRARSRVHRPGTDLIHEAVPQETVDRGPAIPSQTGYGTTAAPWQLCLLGADISGRHDWCRRKPAKTKTSSDASPPAHRGVHLAVDLDLLLAGPALSGGDEHLSSRALRAAPTLPSSVSVQRRWRGHDFSGG